MKMSETIAIPRNRYPSHSKYTTPKSPLGSKELPGINTKLKKMNKLVTYLLQRSSS